MASPDDRTPYDRDTPLAKAQGTDDDLDLSTDDTGVSLPPAAPVPILPPDRGAPY
jgi:hypothetical protein